MNKTELISAMSEKNGLKKKDNDKALSAFMETVSETLEKGEKVLLVGFGTFEVRQRAKRFGRNPRKPEEVIEIPATKVPVFKAGSLLKNVCNKK